MTIMTSEQMREARERGETKTDGERVRREAKGDPIAHAQNQEIGEVVARLEKRRRGRPHVLRTDEEYDAAAARMNELAMLNAEAGSEEDNELTFLELLIADYDDRHYPMSEG
jgi:hypothetical protein